MKISRYSIAWILMLSGSLAWSGAYAWTPASLSPAIRNDLALLGQEQQFCAKVKSGAKNLVLPGIFQEAGKTDPYAMLGALSKADKCWGKPAELYVHLAKISAGHGDALGELMLGLYYARGIPGVLAQNQDIAYKLLDHSATQGFTVSMFFLANSFYRQHHLRHACYWYQQAARTNNALMQYRLAKRCYLGPFHNPAKAAVWLRRAAAGGDPQTKLLVAKLMQSEPQLAAAAAAPPHASPAVAPPAPTPPSAPHPVAPAISPVTPSTPSPQAGAPVAGQPRAVASMQQFWTLYFQASNAQLEDFGMPALVRPVTFRGAP